MAFSKFDNEMQGTEKEMSAAVASMAMSAMMGSYFLAVSNGNYALANEGVQELADSTCELINGFKNAGILVKS